MPHFLRFNKKNIQTMKKFGLGALLVLVTVLLTECRKPECAGDDVPYRTDYEMPTGLNPLAQWVVELPQQDGFNGTLDANASLHAKSIRITSFDGYPLNYISRIYVYLTASGMDDLEIGYNDNVVDVSSNYIDIIPSLPNTTEFLNLDNFGIKLKYFIRREPEQFSTCRLDLVLRLCN